MPRITNLILGGGIYASQKSSRIVQDLELMLNKLSELVSKYRHKSKLILANIK